jgi:hypothetical protein
MLKSALPFGGVLIVIASLLLSACGDPDYKAEPDPSTVKVIKAEVTQ